MSVLSRFFIVGTDIGVDATGITDIELSSLDEILTGTTDREVDSVDDDADNDNNDDDDDALVFVVHADLVAALVEGDTSSLRLAAIRWAMTPELAGADADVLFDLVFDLATLARRAKSMGAAMHLRVEG